MRFMIIIYYYSQYSMARRRGHSVSCIEDDFTEFHRSYGVLLIVGIIHTIYIYVYGKVRSSSII